jgi:hypothetical protein
MIPARNAIDTHAHNELAHYTLLETLDVLSLFAVVELSVSPTNGSPMASLQIRPLSARITSLPVACRHGQLADSVEFNTFSPEGFDL